MRLEFLAIMIALAGAIGLIGPAAEPAPIAATAASNDRGTLVLAASPVFRMVGTSSDGLPAASMFVPVPFHARSVDLHPLGTFTEGSWTRVRWSERKADRFSRDVRLPLAIDHDGPVTVDVWSFWPELRYETFVWGGPADFNVDGAADAFDLLAFQNALAAGEMAADFDRDGVLGFFDVLAFLGAFEMDGHQAPGNGSER